MMKNKVNYYVVASIVLVCIALLLVLFGASNNVCVSFAFIFLGGAILLFMCYRIMAINNTIRAYGDEIDNAVNEPDSVLAEMYKELKRVKRQSWSVKISFSIAGALLIICGILLLV